MSYTEIEQRHIQRVRERVLSSEANKILNRLIGWAEHNESIFVYPVPRGRFSAVHLSTLRNAKTTTDCEFGFSGAKAHIRWWFRKPFFSNRPSVFKEVLQHFDCDCVNGGELATNLTDTKQLELLISFVEAKLS